MPKLTVDPDAFNSVYLPHLTDETRYQLYFGGAGSGKSSFIAVRCVLDALQGRNILVIRQVARTLKTSCWNEISKAITRFGLSRLFRVTART